MLLIEMAFAKVTLGGGISISEVDLRDAGAPEEKCIEARSKDISDDWLRVTDWMIEAHPVLWSFSDSRSYRFYIPAAMRYALRNWEASDAYALESIIYALDRSDDERWCLLSPIQIQAISAFLEYLANLPHSDPEVCAVRQKWKLKAQQSAPLVSGPRGTPPAEAGAAPESPVR